MSRPEFLKPSPSLCAKLGSVVVHAEELFSDNGHAFDRAALKTLLDDDDIALWIEDGRKLAMVPERRKRWKIVRSAANSSTRQPIRSLSAPRCHVEGSTACCNSGGRGVICVACEEAENE